MIKQFPDDAKKQGLHGILKLRRANSKTIDPRRTNIWKDLLCSRGNAGKSISGKALRTVMLSLKMRESLNLLPFLSMNPYPYPSRVDSDAQVVRPIVHLYPIITVHLGKDTRRQRGINEGI
ncbi:hypothetical protein SAY87_001441 [Trapa incisa]|uniref:Uncharacterized protein n=1 Tax=Trapa incisa TaxID=236973 RepID=A0AAN7JHM3_9MYRT|nr:hypothetical protein SAY87_001441 [Trapa incisa]